MVLTGPCLCRTQSVPYSSVLCVLLCYNNKGSLVFTTEVQWVKQLSQNRIYTLTTKWEFGNTLSLYFHCTLFLTFTVFTSWSGETKKYKHKNVIMVRTLNHVQSFQVQNSPSAFTAARNEVNSTRHQHLISSRVLISCQSLIWTQHNIILLK